MTANGNQTIKQIARSIQEEQDIKYTEALRLAQRQVHIDSFDGTGNGSLPNDVEESWLPVLSALKPTKKGQWQLVNVGPGFNVIGVNVMADEADYIVDAISRQELTRIYEEDERHMLDTLPLEELDGNDVATVNGSPDDAIGIAVSVGYGIQEMERLDLRGITDHDERVKTIVQFVDNFVAKHEG